MKQKQSVQTAIDFIEENLKNDLNNARIAESVCQRRCYPLAKLAQYMVDKIKQ